MRHRSGTNMPWLTALLVCLLPSIVSRLAVAAPGAEESRPAAEKPLRVIVFGAHPDDCELSAGETAARWVKLGYKVKFVSVTNGDIGHHQMAVAFLARRRTAEVKRCAEILGIETEVLDISSSRQSSASDPARTTTSRRVAPQCNSSAHALCRLTQRHVEGAWRQFI